MTRERIYLETMERVLGRMDKIILDQKAGNVVPFLPLNDLAQPRPAQQSRTSAQQGAQR